jgi:hypothetical protein
MSRPPRKSTLRRASISDPLSSSNEPSRICAQNQFSPHCPPPKTGQEIEVEPKYANVTSRSLSLRSFSARSAVKSRLMRSTSSATCDRASQRYLTPKAGHVSFPQHFNMYITCCSSARACFSCNLSSISSSSCLFSISKPVSKIYQTFTIPFILIKFTRNHPWIIVSTDLRSILAFRGLAQAHNQKCCALRPDLTIQLL